MTLRARFVLTGALLLASIALHALSAWWARPMEIRFGLAMLGYLFSFAAALVVPHRGEWPRRTRAKLEP